MSEEQSPQKIKEILPKYKTVKILFAQTLEYARKPMNFIIPSAFITALGLALSAYGYFYQFVTPFLTWSFLAFFAVVVFSLYRIEHKDETDREGYARQQAPYNFISFSAFAFCIIFALLGAVIGNPEEKLDIIIAQTEETNNSIEEIKQQLAVQQAGFLATKENNLREAVSSGHYSNNQFISAQLAEIELARSDEQAFDKELEERARDLSRRLESLSRSKNSIPQSLYIEASTAIRQGELEKAEQVFEKIKTDQAVPENAKAEAEYQLGKIAFDKAVYTTAQDHFVSAVNLDRDNPKYLDAIYDIKLVFGNYAEALRAAKEAFEIKLKEHSPDSEVMTDAAYRVQRAQAGVAAVEGFNHMRADAKEAAIKDFQKAIQILENLDPPQYEELAKVYRLMGITHRIKTSSSQPDLDKALEYMQKNKQALLEIYPSDHKRIVWAQNDVEDAEGAIERRDNPPEIHPDVVPEFDEYIDRSPYSKQNKAGE